MENVDDAAAAIHPREAAAALEQADRAAKAAADRLVAPVWYHPVLGLLCGVLVLAEGTGNIPLMMFATLCFGAGCGILVETYRRQAGIWVNVYRSGRAAWYALAVGGVIAAAMVVAMLDSDRWDGAWASAVGALVTFVAVIVLGRRADAVLREQMRGGR